MQDGLSLERYFNWQGNLKFGARLRIMLIQQTSYCLSLWYVGVFSSYVPKKAGKKQLLTEQTLCISLHVRLIPAIARAAFDKNNRGEDDLFTSKLD